MEILFYNKNICSPKVSIVLIDWSCRESFHILQYLACQSVPREKFEIIWIEFYDQQSHEIEVGLEECEKLSKPPIIDKWIVMGTPRNVCFHKHLMYNIGIIAGKGDIITICDSDAIVNPTFVESIIKSFDEDRNIVLHMDEVRNNDRRFYPFNYQSIEEVIGEGCINFKQGKTTGLVDKEDPLHTRNYGACMSALREDVINIGGADEHIDFLGHICGPYEMTFRLVNAGRKEVWHQEELLYHVWHPGQAGFDNFLGPHDGKYMSTTALNIRHTQRILPLIENPVIKILRLKQDEKVSDGILYQSISKEEMENWTVEKLGERSKNRNKSIREPFSETIRMLNIFLNKPVSVLRIAVTLLQVLMKQLSKEKTHFKRIFKEVYRSYLLLTDANKYNAYAEERCRNCLKELASNDIREIALYGTNDVAGILCHLTCQSLVRIKAIYNNSRGKKFFGLDVMPAEEIKYYHGKIVVADLIEIEDKVNTLGKLGVPTERIITL